MLCMHATRSGAVSYLPVVLLARRNRFVCASASGRPHVMEERDNIVSHLQRLFSPQPESHVSDPQTTTEASRTAAVGLLSEDVATDAQDMTDNFVPVAEERDGEVSESPCAMNDLISLFHSHRDNYLTAKASVRGTSAMVAIERLVPRTRCESVGAGWARG